MIFPVERIPLIYFGHLPASLLFYYKLSMYFYEPVVGKRKVTDILSSELISSFYNSNPVKFKSRAPTPT